MSDVTDQILHRLMDTMSRNGDTLLSILERQQEMQARLLDLEQRITAVATTAYELDHLRLQPLEDTVRDRIVTPGPPEAQPWDKDDRIFDPGKPYEKKLIGTDEAGAVMDEDSKMLKRLADEGGAVHMIEEKLHQLKADGPTPQEFKREYENEPNPVQDET